MLTTTFYGILAQLGEHLPYKQRVIGSSPIGPIFMNSGTFLLLQRPSAEYACMFIRFVVCIIMRMPAWRNRQTHRT